MYVIVYDFGTSAVKTCLIEISSTIRLICYTNAEYGLYILGNRKIFHELVYLQLQDHKLSPWYNKYT